MEWISIEEKKPEYYQEILYFSMGDLGICFFCEGNRGALIDGGDWYDVHDISHWMPLPSPPLPISKK